MPSALQNSPSSQCLFFEQLTPVPVPPDVPSVGRTVGAGAACGCGVGAACGCGVGAECGCGVGAGAVAG